MTAVPPVSSNFISRWAGNVVDAVRTAVGAKAAPVDQLAATPGPCRKIRDSTTAGPNALGDCIKRALG